MSVGDVKSGVDAKTASFFLFEKKSSEYNQKKEKATGKKRRCPLTSKKKREKDAGRARAKLSLALSLALCLQQQQRQLGRGLSQAKKNSTHTDRPMT